MKHMSFGRTQILMPSAVYHHNRFCSNGLAMGSQIEPEVICLLATVINGSNAAEQSKRSWVKPTFPLARECHHPVASGSMISPIQQFQDAMQSAGIVPPDAIKADGKLRRFSANGKPGDDAGWYVLYEDGVPSGVFGDWREGSKHIWRADIGRPLTQEEEKDHKGKLDAIKRQRQMVESRDQEEAREEAKRIWAKSVPCAEHPYLTAKNIEARGARIYKNLLVIPVREEEMLHSLQFIDSNGNKKFLHGGRVTGCYFQIGKRASSRALCIVEGFATGVSVNAATGLPVAVAFNAGNLEAVAKTMRRKFPDLPLVLCADDDFRTANNAGRTKATEAARAVGGHVAIPSFGDSRPDDATDFNDMAQLNGNEAVNPVITSAAEKGGINCNIRGKVPSNEDDARTVELLCASDLDPQPISWLWDGWLAGGKVHILGGAPGTGKTTISLDLAATVTTGGGWPDGSQSPIGNVVIWSGEDDPADTLVPRLHLAGADLKRVFFIEAVREGNEKRSFDPARDIEPLQRKLAEIGGVQLLIIDPIVSAIAGDSHKNAEVRRGLQPLADLAASTNCALLGITHFSKGTGGREPVERITGSLAFGAVARVVMVAAKHQEESDAGVDKRLLLRAKSNIGRDDGGFEYELKQAELETTPGIWASQTVWGKAVDGAARDLLAAADVSAEENEGGVLSHVKGFLLGFLVKGPLPFTEVEAYALKANCSEATIRRAKKSLRIVAQKEGGNFGGGESCWIWGLPTTKVAEGAQGNQPEPTSKPPKSPRKNEEIQLNTMSAFSKVEHLQDDDDLVEEEL